MLEQVERLTQANEKQNCLQTHAVGYCAQLTSGSRSWASEIDYFQLFMLFHLWFLSSNQNILLVEATVGGQSFPGLYLGVQLMQD